MNEKDSCKVFFIFIFLGKAVFLGTEKRGEVLRPQTGTVLYSTDTHSQVLVVINEVIQMVSQRISCQKEEKSEC